MKSATLHILLALLLVYPAGAAVPCPEGGVPLVMASNAFAFDLYQRLQKREGNLVFSPYSISTALAMAYAGARGRTEEEMSRVLHFAVPQRRELHETSRALRADVERTCRSEALQLRTANSLWRQEGYSFLDSYLELLSQLYGTEPFVVDFVRETEAARLAINDWVEDKTEGKIVDLIPQGVFDAATTLVLCNAIYFRGFWTHQFDPHETVEGEFHLSPRETITVPTMRQTARLKVREFEWCRALELPYVGDELAMVIILPNALDGISSLEQSLEVGRAAGWLSELFNSEPEPVRVSMPKFRGSSRFELADTLAAMGMPHAFHGADFSGMTGNRDLFISNVIHQAFIEVSEEGTEAAAATTVVMKRGRITEFVVDHPFLFLIMDRKTGAMLFIGRVVDPSVEAIADP